MEDTVTYVDEPEQFETHLADLDRLWELDPDRILPNHGDPEVIAVRRLPEGADPRDPAVHPGARP